jgi:hypothetical protein
MNRTLRPARALFANGPLSLGVLALVYHDFALDWRRYRSVGRPYPLTVPLPLDASGSSPAVRCARHGGGLVRLRRSGHAHDRRLGPLRCGSPAV